MTERNQEQNHVQHEGRERRSKTNYYSKHAQQQQQQQMQQQEVSSNPQNSEKQKRRTRNDTNNRNFACGCGKSYLSYPALYTHLKQKHDGKPPDGTALPQNNGKSGRGRPKNQTDSTDHNNHGQEEDKQSATGDPEEIIEELLQFFDSIDPKYRKNVNKNLSFSAQKLFQ